MNISEIILPNGERIQDRRYYNRREYTCYFIVIPEERNGVKDRREITNSQELKMA